MNNSNNYAQVGVVLAQNNVSRRLVCELAQRLSIAQGDAMIAGYHAELRRIAAAPKGWAFAG